MNHKTTKSGASGKAGSKQVPFANQRAKVRLGGIVSVISIFYPNNQQVLPSFAAYGTTNDNAISNVTVSQGNAVPINIRFAVLRQPAKGGGTWIVSIDMPSGSAGAFVLTVSTSSGATDSKPFSI